jgi:hypothetical protein
MKTFLKNLATQKGEACVTITMQTHRTRPDNFQDPILLKNLIKETEQRLKLEFPHDVVVDRINKLNKLAAEIDHDKNLNGLILAVGNETAEYLQLPIKVENRVVVNKSFATRALMRALQEQADYYVLVLSRQKARLIRAYADQVIEESGNPFPIENTDLYETSRLKQSMANTSENLIEEFFNRVDKAVQPIWKENPAPIFLATEIRNFDHYLKVEDHNAVVGQVNPTHDNEKAHQVILSSWPSVQQQIHLLNKERIGQLKDVSGNRKYVSNLNDIWLALQEGRGDTLFVKRGFHQPARIVNNNVVITDEINGYMVIEDIVDEMIEANQNHGGSTVFVDEDDLAPFQGVALTTRF